MTYTQHPLRVVSVGDLVADLVATIPSLPVHAGQHQHAHAVKVEPGGAGNFLLAGARLGMRMSALGTLGEDFFGQAVADRLEAEGVDLTGVVRSPGSTTTTVIVLVDDQGGHVFLGAYGEGPLVAAPPIWEETVAASQAVFSAGYTLQEKRISAATFELMEFAHRSGVPVFFDPGFEMARCTTEQIQRALASSRVILLTGEELPILTGGPDSVDAARALLDAGPELVCLKRGAQGCLLVTRDGAVEHPGYPVVVRDTAAAGDSFDAAFIYAWLRGWQLPDIAAFANAMGAAKVQKLGSGSSVPTAAEVQQVLDTYGVDLSILPKGQTE